MKKILVLSSLITLFAAPSLLAVCEKCQGVWPGRSCQPVSGSQTGNTECTEDTLGWCTYESGGETCDAKGSCSNRPCEPENKASFVLPEVAEGETLVLTAAPTCRIAGQIIEA